MARKLSNKQAEIVAAMKNGWTLRCQSPGGPATLEDGRAIRVSRSTLVALLRAGVIIEAKRQHPNVFYKLTDA